MKKKKKILALFLLLGFALSILLSFTALVSETFVAHGAYLNQEKIPGYDQTYCFPDYVKQIINFGFATIGILALFMLAIGAYQYLMSAGNIGSADSAKATIGSALGGLILGLCAYLILNTINPDLVSMKDPSGLNCGGSSTSTGSGPTSATATQPTTSEKPSANAGKCVEGTGNCSEANMSCFGSEAKNASIVCNAESGGVVKAGGDKCGGSNVSYGLMQMNTSCHNLGLGCENAFKRTDTGKNCCIGSNGCRNSNCQISDTGLYEQCIKKMQDPTSNLQAACALWKNSGWGPWSGARKCGIS